MMKTLLKQVCTLRRALLVVTLLCSLFACLGGDYANANRPKQTTRTELCRAYKQEIIHSRKPEYIRLKSSGFVGQFSLRKSLLVYNKVVNAKIANYCRRNVSNLQSGKFVQRKTIPADSSDVDALPAVS